MDDKLKIGVGIGIAAIIAAGGGYCLLSSDKQTPEIAIHNVEQSIANHNRAEFYKGVNLDSILDYSYDGIINSLTDSDKTMPPEAKDSVKRFTTMLRTPIILSMKAAIDSYVATGNLGADAGIVELFGRTGIDRIEYRGVERVDINPENANEATARIKIYQPDLDQELLIVAQLNCDSDGNWQIVRLNNFQDLVNSVNSVRSVQLNKYLVQSADVISRHETIIREAEQKYASILATGTVGQENIRADLKALMIDVVQKDWAARKQELSALSVPPEAQALQSMRLKICDLEIGYAQDYVNWMDDMKEMTIKAAEDKKAQARDLSAAATALANKLSGQEEVTPNEN